MILLATFIPKGSFALNPSLIDDDHAPPASADDVVDGKVLEKSGRHDSDSEDGKVAV